MSKNWYPIIDTDHCSNCKNCIDFCRQNVFQVINGHVVVSDPEECIWQCKECESKCSSNAILQVCDFQYRNNEFDS